jgi:hypothetical protein
MANFFDQYDASVETKRSKEKEAGNFFDQFDTKKVAKEELRTEARADVKPEDLSTLSRFGSALSGGLESLKDIPRGLGLGKESVIGTREETAKKMEAIKEAKAKEAAEGPKNLSFADLERIYAEKGLASAASNVPSYIAEAFLQSAPQMAGPLAAGAVASPFLTPVGGAVVGIGAYGLQQFGNFLVRQAEEKDNPEELEVAKAAIGAAGSAPLGYFVDRFTAGLGKLGGKEVSKQAAKELAARRVAGEIGAGTVAKEVGKRAAVGATVGIVAEAPTEWLETVVERWQADLSLTGEDAKREYKEAFFGGAGVGGTLGGASRGLSTYGEYKEAKKDEKVLQQLRSEPKTGKNAFTEADEYGTKQPIPGADQLGLSLSDEQSVADTGLAGTAATDLAGTGSTANVAGAGKDAGVDQLDLFSAEQLAASEINRLTTSISEINAKEFEIASVNENAPELAELAAAKASLQQELDFINAQLAAKAGRPVDTNSMFLSTGELNPDYIHPDDRQPLTEEQQIAVAKSIPLTNKAVKQGFTMDEKGNAVKVSPNQTALFAPGQEQEQAPTAKLMLVGGDTQNPVKGVQRFFNGLKPVSDNPSEQNKFKTEVKKLINDVQTFVGETLDERLDTKEMSKRINVLRNFFDGLSKAPLEQEELTSSLSQRMLGMSAEDQVSTVDNLLNTPLNTRRNIEGLREQLRQTVVNYERARMGEPTQQTAIELTKTPFSFDESISSDRVAEVIRTLGKIPKNERTREENAAWAYFGENEYSAGYGYGMGMRAAAFDLASDAQATNTSPIFKNQNKEQAELFMKWVEDNLPANEFNKFTATVDNYTEQFSKQTAADVERDADVAEETKPVEETELTGLNIRNYAKMIGRPPTGKVGKGEGFKSEAGLGPSSKAGKPAVTKIVGPFGKKDIYTPLHPAIEQKLRQNDLNGALRLLEHSGNKFQSGLARRLRELELTTSVTFDDQQAIAQSILTSKISNQRNDLFAYIQQAHPDIFNTYFADVNNIYTISRGLEAIKDGKVKVDTNPIIGQLDDMLEAYKDGVALLKASGTYLPYMNSINLNSGRGGTSTYAFLHETSHAGTQYALEPENYAKLNATQKKAVDELNKLYAFAKRLNVVSDEYGFRNVHEFVAEAFSNEQFQQLLKELKYKADTNVSMWDRFTQLVAKIFGMDNVLGYTLANANLIFQASPEMSASVSAVNAQGKVLGGTKASKKTASKIQATMNGRTTWEVAKEGVKGFLADLDNLARKHYLGAFTLRQLSDLVGPRIREFKTFISTTEAMFNERNRVLEDTKNIHARWQRWQNDNPEKATIFNKLLIDVTLDDRQGKVNKDPALGVTGIDTTDKAWQDIGSEGQGIYVQVRDFYRERFNDYVRSAIANKENVMLTTGFNQSNIDWHNNNKNIKIPNIEAFRNKLKQHTVPSTRTTDSGALETYQRNLTADEITTQLNEFTKKELVLRGVSELDIAAHLELKALESHFKKDQVDVYFPIKRFGEFSLQLGKGKDMEFYLFESPKERRLFVKNKLQQQANGSYKDTQTGKIYTETDIRESNSLQDLSNKNIKDFEFLDRLKLLIGNIDTSDTTKIAPNLTKEVEQLYYLFLPDQSIRKMFMHRKGTSGMDEDMLRAFTDSAFHMAYQQARFKYSPTLHNLINNARENLEYVGRKQFTEDFDYIQELENRLDYITDPADTGMIPAIASNLSFAWYMTSPASALVNMLGVPAVGFPIVGARYGMIKTGAKMAEYSKKFAGAGFKNQNKEWDYPSLANKKDLLNAAQQRAYDQFVIDGLIDVSLAHDVQGMTDKPSELYTGKAHFVMKVLGSTFHAAEKFNREVVAMSVFDLAYDQAIKDGYKPEFAEKKAIAAAKELTYKSMFDYSTINKPRYFQGKYAKIFLQFKQFSQQMTYLLLRSTYEGATSNYTNEELFDIKEQIVGERKTNMPDAAPLTEEELNQAVVAYLKDVRREAVRRLQGTLGMTAVFAGTTGLPLFSMVSSIIEAMHAVFKDDDEPEMYFDNWFKNEMDRIFGGFVGDSISRGVASQVLGGALADRLSLNDLWYKDARRSPDSVSWFQNLIVSLMGPTIGIGVNFANAYDQLQDGHIWRSIETAMPAVIKNFMKGIRFSDLGEGKATAANTGNTIMDDFSTSEVIGQALGFTPERFAQKQKSNFESKTADVEIGEKKTRLMNALFMAVDNGDSSLLDKTLEKIGTFNATYPDYGITSDSLESSIETRYKNRAIAEEFTGGVNISKKGIPRAMEMQQYGNSDK